MSTCTATDRFDLPNWLKMQEIVDAYNKLFVYWQSWAVSNSQPVMNANVGALKVQLQPLADAYKNAAQLQLKYDAFKAFKAVFNPWRVLESCLGMLATTPRNACLQSTMNTIGSRNRVQYLDGMAIQGRAEQALQWFIDWASDILQINAFIEYITKTSKAYHAN
jgi:hypothetical protein